MAEKGEIEQCLDCGTWHNSNEECVCKNIKKKETNNSGNELTCIICEEPSNGKHFCYSCYQKYKSKALYIKVTKCKNFEKLDAEYESDLECDDGHFVKSPYEKIIDNYLYSQGIQHAYEKKLDIDETHDITPDFYLNEYEGTKNIYIEFWGYEDGTNKKYQETKEYKTGIYPELCKRKNIAVVYLNKKEVDDNSFKKKIKYAKSGEIKE